MDRLLPSVIMATLVAAAASACSILGGSSSTSGRDALAADADADGSAAPNGQIVLAGGGPYFGAVPLGQNQSVSVALLANAQLSNVTVSIQIRDAANTVVAEKVFPGQNFSAYQTQTFEYSFSTSQSFAVGPYTVGASATDATAQTVYFSQSSITSFVVTEDTSGHPSPPADSGTLPADAGTQPADAGTPPDTDSSAPGTTLTNIDGNFDSGWNSSVTVNAPLASGVAGVYSSSGSGQELWLIYPNTYAVATGTGSVKMTYAPGAVTTTVDLKNINNAAVSAYPEIVLGSDVFGYHNGEQGPQFPAQLGSMSSLVIDTQYNLNISPSFGGNIDVLFDLWLAPSPTFAGGQAGSVEVEILPYFRFPAGFWGQYIKTFTVPVVLNGVSTTMNFLEYAAQAVGSGGGKGPGTDILFYPAVDKGLPAAAIKFDAALFLNEAAATSGVGTSWYLPGIDFGTEFGATTAIAYTFTVNRLGIAQTLR